MNPYYKEFGPWLTERIGCKVQKISVNAGFTCPNRDGRVGWGGCTYCNNQTFNPVYCRTEKTIVQQIEEGKTFFARKYPSMKYLAYFQAYTNTYGKTDELMTMYESALSVDDVVGVVIGTRPDCVSEELLDALAALGKKCFVLVEYGIESPDDEVLRMINRGHDYQCVERTVRLTHERGLPVGGHVILGLPMKVSEVGHFMRYRQRLVDEAAVISCLPLDTLKIHQLQLIKGTRMAVEYEEHPERFHLFGVDEYIDLVIDYISCLRSDLVLERFVSQSPPELLAVSGWGLKNHEFTAKLHHKLAENRREIVEQTGAKEHTDIMKTKAL